MSEGIPQEQANEFVQVKITIKDHGDITLRTFQANTIGTIASEIQNVETLSSFNLLLNGQVLNAETTLAELLETPEQKTLQLQLKNKAYTERAITEHVALFRTYIGLAQGSEFGINSGLSKFNGLALDTVKATEETEEKKKDELPEPTEQETSEVATIVTQFFTDLPESYYTPNAVIKPAVSALFLSTWNPVPLTFRTRGHLVYLVLQTLEGETFHITGSTTGFYVAKSSNARFDPTPKDQSFESFTLFELISKVSKQFVNQINASKEKSTTLEPATYVAPLSTSLANPWITKAQQTTPALGHTDFDESHANKDFNEEYQLVKDTDAETIQERIAKEEALSRAAHKFTESSVKGALAVLNGAISPINPEEDEQYHIFLHNNVFYSFGADVGTFAEKGGLEAARAASNQDLQAIKYLNNINSDEIHTLLTTIVDYAGRRVVAQTPVPGLFNYTKAREVQNEAGETVTIPSEPLTTIEYGYDEALDKVQSTEEFVKALQPFKKALHLEGKKTEEGQEIVTNKTIKGLVGTDNRKYLIELYNSTPLDIEFIESHYKPEEQDSYPHRQTVVRMEAVQNWWTSQINKLINEEAEKRGIDLSVKIKEGDEIPEFSVKDEDVTFSVDAFETPDKEDANVRSVSKYITETLIPSFLEQFKSSGSLLPSDGSSLTSNLHKVGINVRYLGQIAKLVDQRIAEADEEAAKVVERNAEINKKFEEDYAALQETVQANAKKAHEEGKEYKIAEDPASKKFEEYEETDPAIISLSVQYKSLLTLVQQELVARVAKHILRKLSANLPPVLVPSLVAHFHNALLGYQVDASPEISIPHKDLYSDADLSFTQLTAESVRELINKEVFVRYRYSLPANWIEAIPLRPLQREIAIKFGIQWDQREYFFTTESREQYEKEHAPKKRSKKAKSQSPEPTAVKILTFATEDVSLVPVVKDVAIRSTTAEQIFEAGRSQVASEDDVQKQEGFAMLTDGIQIYEQVYGLVHPEVQRAYSILAQVYTDNGKKVEAVIAARRSAAIAERVFGLDSYELLMSLMNLAYLESDAGSLKNSLKVYARVTQLWQSMFHGYNITIVTIIANITATLQNEGFLDPAVSLTQKLLKVSNEVHGGRSYTSALLKFRLAFIYGLTEKFAQAVKDAQESVSILKELASTSHFMTRQAWILERQVTEYKKAQVENEKRAKEFDQAAKKIQAEKEKKRISEKKIGDNLSVDEALAFVLGGSSQRKAKGPAQTSKKSKKNGKK